MKKRRNGNGASLGDWCDYDEAVGTLQGLADGSSGTLSLEPAWAKAFLPYYVQVIALSSTNPQTTRRVKITQVQIGPVDQTEFSQSANAAAAGLIVPDFFSAEACCLGMPVCWGLFGRESDNQELQMTIFNESGDTVDVFVVTRGKKYCEIPPGMTPGCVPDKRRPTDRMAPPRPAM